MPLRTDRGRAAVYRRLWGWPLRSRAHLAGALLGAAALVAVISTAAAAVQEHRPDPVRQQPPLPAQPSGPPPAAHRPAPPAPAPPDAVSAAAEFANRWVVHPPGMPATAWTGQLQPLSEPELLIRLADVDPARVPGTQVTGPPATVNTADQVVTVAVPTDAGPLTVTVAHSAAGWRVHQVEQAEAPR